MLGNIIVLLIVTALVAGAIAKILSDRRKGVRCSGCPDSFVCANKSLCPSREPSSPGNEES